MLWKNAESRQAWHGKSFLLDLHDRMTGYSMVYNSAFYNFVPWTILRKNWMLRGNSYNAINVCSFLPLVFPVQISNADRSWRDKSSGKLDVEGGSHPRRERGAERGRNALNRLLSIDSKSIELIPPMDSPFPFRSPGVSKLSRANTITLIFIANHETSICL